MKFLILPILALLINSCGAARGMTIQPVANTAGEFNIIEGLCLGGVLTIDQYYQDQVIAHLECGDFNATTGKFLKDSFIGFESLDFSDGTYFFVIERNQFNELMKKHEVRKVGEQGYFQLPATWGEFYAQNFKE